MLRQTLVHTLESLSCKTLRDLRKFLKLGQDDLQIAGDSLNDSKGIC
jgi:hypothetical protein